MSYKCREEVVGKRFLSVSGFSKLKSAKIGDWGWRAGVIRAATHKDTNNTDLQVLVEYDDVEWHRREWLSVFKDGLFNLFMIEQSLIWAERKDPFKSAHTTVLWPALTFSALVCTVDISPQLQPVEFLFDRELAFKEYKLLKPFQEWDSSLPGVRDYPEVRAAVRCWCEQQDGQKILLTTPSVLVGYRVEVYRAEGTTQWYTAVIVGYNEATRDLTVTDDTVLEEHNEDPALVQMRLIGDGVVESIMRGEDVGITPRRSRSAVLQTHQHHQQLHNSRVVRGPSSVTLSNSGGSTSANGGALNGRKSRSLRPTHVTIPNSDARISPDPTDKGASGKSKKRKQPESESSSGKGRNNHNFSDIKEDLENKQSNRRKNGRRVNRKKVLEEANNSKLREVEVRVEDCLQNVSALSVLCRSNLVVVSGLKDEEESSNVAAEENTEEDSSVASVSHQEDTDCRVSEDEGSSNSSSVQLVQVVPVVDENEGECAQMPVSEAVNCEVVSEEDDCVIVGSKVEENTTSNVKEANSVVLEQKCSIRDDDEGGVGGSRTRASSSSASGGLQLFSGSRMDLGDPVVNANTTVGLLQLHQLRGSQIADDRSDSGVSSLRSGSGDERSGSRSSALSSTDEQPPPHIVTVNNGSSSSSSASSTSSQQSHSSTNRSPLFIPSSVPPPISAPSPAGPAAVPGEQQVRVWRDPNLLLESEPHVRHIHSVQHQSLLMSHPSAPASSGPPQTSSAAPTSHPSAASLYPPAPPALMPTHAHHQIHLPMYHLPDIWKHPRYPSLPVSAAHLLTQQAHTDDMIERERERMMDRERHERMLRERQNQELEKQKEKERLERQEKERLEREKQEKDRQNQALQNHFEKSLRVAEQKRGAEWNALSGRPPQPRTSSLSEDDRKRVMEQHMSIRADQRDHRSYYATVQRPQSVPGKTEYPPPPAHSSRITSNKSSDKVHPTMQKSDLNVYGYPACHPQTQFFEPKNKAEHHKTSQQQQGLVVTKTGGMDRERELPNPPPLVSEMKNSVIVKHEKNPHMLEPRVSIPHSPSPKLRTEMLGHYMQPSGQTPKSGIYEYRSPTQSPHHLPHTPSPHHHMEPQNLGKPTSHHRQPSSGQLPSPHQTQRHSPHPQAQHHSPADIRYRSTPESSQAMIYPTSGKGNYPFLSSTTATPYTLATATTVNSKPKVSSPAPHHIYGKPSAGVSVVPVTRGHESPVNPMQLTVKPPLSSSVSPSPYQQVSQYHPPHPQQAQPMMTCPPPPAHSSRPTSYDNRLYSPGSAPGAMTAKLSVHHGTSPPTAASAPLPVSRSHPQYPPGITVCLQPPSMQTQPLDLGVSSNKYDSSSLSPKRKGTPISTGVSSPVCLEKKRKLDNPSTLNSSSIQQSLTMFSTSGGQPQLARVSEPSPLIASAATTITTVVNTAAYRTPATTVTSPSPTTVLTNNLPDVSVTAVTVPVQGEAVRPNSTDSSQRPPSVPQSISPSPVVGAAATSSSTAVSNTSTEESPTTPIKTPIPPPPPSSVDSEKSNSPGPIKTSTYPVRHLKKAWLKRHTGEDMDDPTVMSSGSLITIPIKTNPIIKENPVNSIHCVGTMAVNSISKPKHFKGSANRKPAKEPNIATVNGHQNESSKGGDDSSSSDQERGRKSPPKRKPPKVKRKKGGGAPPKKTTEDKKRKTGNQSAVASESGSDSEKESGSEKDSDSGASTTVASSGSTGKKSNSGGGNNSNVGKEPRKRGRRPKSSKNDKGEEPRPKKSKDDSLPQRDPFRKPPVGQLKKTGESFLQDGPCFEVAPKLAKCRECRWTPNQRSKNMPNIFCRFFAFRRLRYTKNGQLAIAGFSDPHKDALEDDLKLWLPNTEVPPSDLDLETSRFLLKQVGDHFCDLLVQEKEAQTEHMSDDKTIAWKRVVQGVREMCDVCETTLFNFHWTCGKCGFVVCLDCYKSRKSGTIKVWGEPGKDKDDYSWLLCTNRSAHEQEKLMLTQIIAGDSLAKLGRKVHEMRDLWSIEQYCACPTSKEVCQKSNNLAFKEIVKGILADKLNGIKREIKDEDCKSVNGMIKEEKTSPLSWLADVALSNEDKKNEDSSSDSEDGAFSTLRELLIRPSHKPNGSRATSPVGQQKNSKKTNINKCDSLDDVISSVIEDNVPKATEHTEAKSELKHFVRRYNWQARGRAPIPIRIMTLTESKMLYPDVPHSWLCDGKLLRLSDATHKENYKIFQDQWKRGQPVIVSDVTKNLDRNLWNPDAFARDFGDEKNDLINCMTGNLVPNQPMKKFWEGFDHFSKRLKDDRGNPMLLKLKDWPPGEDFAEMLPSRYNDLMKVLPLAEYTHRTGRLNLASRLPDCFVRPDLGPKMYNAYGSALHPSKGTTNLHLDISDAVNVMVYVGIPKDGDSDEHIKEAFRAIDEAGCDILTRRRVRDKGELPGALWHIYNARDADKIRDLLNKVVVEKGGRLEPHHDPIHDQSCYLDGPLRERLYKEYGVEGYAIVQCLGDAVFIPAGAPHQVRNLHNCIKVAEDFVSPENVSHCFHLTQEFRDLTDTHSNHEDKLQIKNIIYHAVKDSLSSLSAILTKHVNVKSESKDSAERNGGSGSGTGSDSQQSNQDGTEPA